METQLPTIHKMEEIIMAERNYGLHSSITVLVLESILANVRAGNATVAAMEFEQYKGELLKNE